MKETTDELDGATILKVELLTDDDVTVHKDGYSSYELLVTTNRGILRFAGCHDLTGSIEILDGRLTQHNEK